MRETSRHIDTQHLVCEARRFLCAILAWTIALTSCPFPSVWATPERGHQPSRRTASTETLRPRATANNTLAHEAMDQLEEELSGQFVPLTAELTARFDTPSEFRAVRERVGKYIALGGKVNMVTVLGGTYMRHGMLLGTEPLGDLISETWEAWEPGTDPARIRARIFDRIADVNIAWARSLGLGPQDIGVVGISWAGSGNIAAGRAFATQIEGLRTIDSDPATIAADGFPLLQELDARFEQRGFPNVRTALLHDGAAFALGEYFLLTGRWADYTYAAGKVRDHIGEQGHFMVGVVTPDGIRYEDRTPEDGSFPPLRRQTGEFAQFGLSQGEFYVDTLLSGPGVARRFVEEVVRGQGADAAGWLDIPVDQQRRATIDELLSAVVLPDEKDPEHPDLVVHDADLVNHIQARIARGLEAEDPFTQAFAERIEREVGQFLRMILEAYPTGFFIAVIIGSGIGSGFIILPNPDDETRIVLVGGMAQNFHRPIGAAPDAFIENVREVAGLARDSTRIIRSPHGGRGELLAFGSFATATDLAALTALGSEPPPDVDRAGATLDGTGPISTLVTPGAVGGSNSDEHILAAIGQLQARTSTAAITQGTIATEAGVSERTVSRRKAANAVVAAAIAAAAPIAAALRSPSDAKILAAIGRLQVRTPLVAITQGTIAAEAGVSKPTVSRRNAVNDAVAAAIEIAWRPTSDAKILAAIGRLQARTPAVAITQGAIAEEAGVSEPTVTVRKAASREVAAAIEAAVLSADAKILAAIKRLQARTPPVAITQGAIAEEASVSEATVTTRKAANREVAAAIEAALRTEADAKILAAIELLQARTPPVAITQRAIAEKAGLDETNVSKRKAANPAVKAAIEAAVPSSDAKILAAIGRLRAQTPPGGITRVAIAKEAGLDISTVKRRIAANPVVKAAFEEAVMLSAAQILTMIAAVSATPADQRDPTTRSDDGTNRAGATLAGVVDPHAWDVAPRPVAFEVGVQLESLGAPLINP